MHGIKNCLKRTFVEHVDLESVDNEELFRARRRVGWMGFDSLYDAWLIANFNQFRVDENSFTR